MSEIHIFVHDAEGAGRMNRFVHTEFLALLKKAERVTLDKFNAAVSAVEKPAVRLHFEDAGFLKKYLKNGQTFKQDPIFKIFNKWLHWSVTSKREPATGAVTGDTWRDFLREYKNGQNRVIFCEILEFGDAEPIEGFLHQDLPYASLKIAFSFWKTLGSKSIINS